MNVHTGEFRALTDHVDRLADRLENRDSSI